jgi:hypothetical protein
MNEVKLLIGGGGLAMACRQPAGVGTSHTDTPGAKYAFA